MGVFYAAGAPEFLIFNGFGVGVNGSDEKQLDLSYDRDKNECIIKK